MPSTPPPESGSGCPSREELLAYTTGRLPSHLQDTMADHLSTCPACESVLEELQSENNALDSKLWRFVPEEPVQEANAALSQARTVEMNRSPEPTGSFPARGATEVASTIGDLSTTTFGNYQLLEKVGEGGMGVVYKARQISLNRLVALKMLLSGVHARREDMARFRTEGEAIARLRHPYVVQIYELGEHEGRPYLTMEFVEGGNLAGRLVGKPLPPREAAELIRKLAVAIEAAHACRIVHRDLKPANVLLSADGTPRITDFGLAKLLDAEVGQTISDAVIGTACYMAPEQARGNIKEVGPLADVYALGAILYELLTGRPPFRAPSRQETLEQVQTLEPVAPSRLEHTVPRDLEAICLKCLEKEPKRRYPSGAALADDLGRWLEGAPLSVRPARWPGKLWRTARRRPVVSGLVLLTILGMVLAPALLIYFDPERPLRNLEARLAKGQPVTLIGETGKPVWARWCVRGEAAQLGLATDGAFTIHSWTLSLLELVRDPQHERYRISAEIRHEKSDEVGEVGLYFLHRQYPRPEGPIHYYSQMSFNDVRDVGEIQEGLAQIARRPLPPLKANPVGIYPRLYFEQGDAGGRITTISGVSQEVLKPTSLTGGPWRKLTVEVTPEGLRGLWEDKQLIGDLPVATQQRSIQNALVGIRILRPDDTSVKDLSPEFDPRGSLGICLLKGSASFRNLIVEPVVERN